MLNITRIPYSRRSKSVSASDEQPLRAELFSVSQLDRHATTLAGWHKVLPPGKSPPDKLLQRLADNAAALHEAHELVTSALHSGTRITPAAEWFVDNYHLIEEQIRTARKHLPRSYSRELPRLSNSPLSGTPRVYDLAIELISHSHGRVDIEGLRAFITSYQATGPLRLGELWAIPIMLRLALIENLRRVVAIITAGRRDRARAAYWADELLARAASQPAEVVTVLAALVAENPPLTDPFVSELMGRLQGQSAALGFPIAWIEQRLGERGETIDQAFQRVSQSQADSQVAIGNSIGSVRFLGATDWRVFVESMSVVEQLLRTDPSAVYATMDFATRNRYRQVVEAIAKRSTSSEEEVARSAIALARAEYNSDSSAESKARTAHVGYFLVDEGRRTLEQAARMRSSLTMLADRLGRGARFPLYVAAIVLLTALITVVLFFTAPLGEMRLAMRVASLLVLRICASQLALGIVHFAMTLLVRPGILPRLDFSAGIPPEQRTVVAVPTLLTDATEIEGLLESLEVRFLANRDPQLVFALVSDFRDAPHEKMPDDDQLLRCATQGIAALNAKYTLPDGPVPFYLFHRDRLLNEREGVWMGWERKRGKLEQLNEAVRGNHKHFATIIGDLVALQGVKYVIVLDSDTQLPREAAQKLVSTIAHPLNRPLYDQTRGRITRGYSVLQPRVATTMESTARSRFAQLLGGEPGIDPYTHAVSDVYQDLFAEGSFVGKGIYEVDAFQKALGRRLPENRILSHDLLEGAYARAGLVSDVILFEDYPSSYVVDVSRRYRWARGDWQIAPWLGGMVPGLGDRRVKNPISLLSRWKILDNLRRSLVPLALLTLLMAGWMTRGAGAYGMLAVGGILLIPGLLAVLAALLRRPSELPRGRYLGEIGLTFARQLGREALALACLPYEVFILFIAKLYTLVRVLFTGRKLLEWRTASDAQRSASKSLGQTYVTMAVAPLFAVLTAGGLALGNRLALFLATPVLALWALAPALAWWLSRPGRPPRPHLGATERKFLRTVARRTWRFFETYVAAADNYLPPDNFQEEPPRGVAHRTTARLDQIRELAARCTQFADLDFDFLYQRERHLLSIGYNVADHRLDASFYDLLASEARLASFVAIAHGKLPQEHWFSLGRQLTSWGDKPALLSWSGSMFEYLMPLLVMPTYEHTLLDETYQSVVARQIAYGKERGVPWGVSESGYNKTDAQLNYQYRAFGVPGLGFKRGLADDLVIAPYASVMALMVAPTAATANLQLLAQNGILGALGFYEAVDYTPARLPRDKSSAIVRSYMAHHQGMSFLALAYLLLDRPMQRRFLADPALRATELLLQERVPRTLAVYPHPSEVVAGSETVKEPGGNLRVFTTPFTPAPEVQLLSNGRYHVAITNAGGGYSRFRELAITRFYEDPTRDCWGSFCYLRDVSSGEFWSVAYQPTLKPATRYEAIFSTGRAEFRRRDGELDTHVEIAISPEDDVELRRVSITNRGRTPRTIEFTSYAEVVLATPAADAAHPAFSNLFVQTELLRPRPAILCTRRPRSGKEEQPWMLHLMTVQGTQVGETSYETGRAEFIGRGRTISDPLAMHRPALGNSAGAVLDPVVAIRNTVVIGPDETVRIHLVTGIAEQREEALRLVEKYSDRLSAERVFELSWTHSQVSAQRLELSEAEVQLCERLVSHILFANPTLRAPRSILSRNLSGQSALWAYGISGDLPIVLLRIADRDNLDLLRQLIKAHAYWRLKGLVVDLIIWNEDLSGYRQVLQEEILGILGSQQSEASLLDKPGGTFVRRTDQLSEADKILMQTVARLIISDADGSLTDQLNRRLHGELPPQLFAAQDHPAWHRPLALTPQRFERPDLTAWNGHGGFTPDGKEYVITTTLSSPTPAPWVNVLANPYFGTIVSESGGSYTWCENAQSYRLTPWNNDPVGDLSGEAFYLRDESDGHFWSPTLLPAGGAQPYTTRHGFGYSVFEYSDRGITSELRTYVALDAPIKFMVFKIRNTSGRPRKLSLTALYELVLGTNRAANLPYVVTEIDASGALVARNTYGSEFAARVAFLDCSEPVRTVSGDRGEVIGRNGTPARPDCMTRVRLSGRVGAGLDPCLALQVPLELADGQERELAFTFGSGRDLGDARTLVSRFRGTGPARAALENVWGYWNRTLGAVNVQTPDAGLNFLCNGWLLYQVLASRLWGRSGFYQSGGAFGFRDQLQDAMALIHTAPALLREQIVRSAARQFPEGDVQHWWHPPLGRGVRTRISDDYLWLPYAVCRYVTAIGDTGILDEKIHFLSGRTLKPEEENYYDLPLISDDTAPLYDHCVRAIKHGLRLGQHGLPLMGSGDWNDGMNLVGEHGQGESVWLAFFLYDVLTRFADLAQKRGDIAFADQCIAEAAKLRLNIEAHGWDGEWYRRAYFDNGEPLGSATNPECQIDSLPQSWAVLSGAGEATRSQKALAALDRRLVRRDLGLIQLFDPPLDSSALNPGYVKGYVPGVRENGGQYTHAAVWAVMAFAATGDVERAWELFGLINPVRHGDSEQAIATYKVEPYVVAADVYTNPQHQGRGGWTWYTGSAGWMYRLVIESLLGLRLVVDKLHLEPLIPSAWASFDVHYRHYQTLYHIHIRNLGGGRKVKRVVCDGLEQADKTISLRNDGQEHRAEVELGG